ncbi:MAG: hypothetical protein RR907_10630, partial [Comamonas sp.]
MKKRQFLTTAASGTAWAAVASSALLSACTTAAVGESKPQPQAPAQTAARPSQAEQIYFGGPILTMNDAQRQVQALAVANGLILAVGTRDEIFALRGTETRMVDLQGRTLIPGFVDP